MRANTDTNANANANAQSRTTLTLSSRSPLDVQLLPPFTPDASRLDLRLLASHCKPLSSPSRLSAAVYAVIQSPIMDHQQNNNHDALGNGMSAALDPSSMPQLDQQQDFMNQQFDANGMMGILPGQGFMPDPSMGGMPLDNPMMMPFMFANGNAALQIPPNGISEGTGPRNSFPVSFPSIPSADHL